MCMYYWLIQTYTKITVQLDKLNSFELVYDIMMNKGRMYRTWLDHNVKTEYDKLNSAN